jgi:hypothetical protein
LASEFLLGSDANLGPGEIWFKDVVTNRDAESPVAKQLIQLRSARMDGNGLVWESVNAATSFFEVRVAFLTPRSILLFGDYNENGVVDAADYVLWRDTLGKSVPASYGADGDGDGIIDTDDYGVWKAHFGEALPVTEPPLAGHYNQNNVVDAADYTVWRNTLGTGGLAPYDGADGDGNGSVGPEDYGVWKMHFGQTLPPGAGGGAVEFASANLRQGVRLGESSTSSDLQAGSESARIVAADLPLVESGRRATDARPIYAGAPAPRVRDEALVAWLASRAGEYRAWNGDLEFSLVDGSGADDGDETQFGAMDEALDALLLEAI